MLTDPGGAPSFPVRILQNGYPPPSLGTTLTRSRLEVEAGLRFLLLPVVNVCILVRWWAGLCTMPGVGTGSGFYLGERAEPGCHNVRCRTSAFPGVSPPFAVPMNNLYTSTATAQGALF